MTSFQQEYFIRCLDVHIFHFAFEAVKATENFGNFTPLETTHFILMRETATRETPY
jgi:hypothetical protein